MTEGHLHQFKIELVIRLNSLNVEYFSTYFLFSFDNFEIWSHENMI